MTSIYTLIIVVALGLVAWFLREYLRNIVQEAVKLAFSKELEDYKAQLKRHEQAVTVAALLARRVGGTPHQESVNRQIWEAQLWLPAPIAQRLSEVLVNDASPAAVKGLLICISYGSAAQYLFPQIQRSSTEPQPNEGKYANSCCRTRGQKRLHIDAPL